MDSWWIVEMNAGNAGMAIIHHILMTDKLVRLCGMVSLPWTQVSWMNQSAEMHFGRDQTAKSWRNGQIGRQLNIHNQTDSEQNTDVNILFYKHISTSHSKKAKEGRKFQDQSMVNIQDHIKVKRYSKAKSE